MQTNHYFFSIKKLGKKLWKKLIFKLLTKNNFWMNILFDERCWKEKTHWWVGLNFKIFISVQEIFNIKRNHLNPFKEMKQSNLFFFFSQKMFNSHWTCNLTWFSHTLHTRADQESGRGRERKGPRERGCENVRESEGGRECVSLQAKDLQFCSSIFKFSKKSFFSTESCCQQFLKKVSIC